MERELHTGFVVLILRNFEAKETFFLREEGFEKFLFLFFSIPKSGMKR